MTEGFRPERGGERKGRGNIILTHRTPRGRWMTGRAGTAKGVAFGLYILIGEGV